MAGWVVFQCLNALCHVVPSSSSSSTAPTGFHIRALDKNKKTPVKDLLSRRKRKKNSRASNVVKA
jgi:hypothetical protein